MGVCKRGTLFVVGVINRGRREQGHSLDGSRQHLGLLLGLFVGVAHLAHLFQRGRKALGHFGLAFLQFLDLIEIVVELVGVFVVHLGLKVLEDALDLLAVALLDADQLFFVGRQVPVDGHLLGVYFLLHAAVLELEVALFVLRTPKGELQVLILLVLLLDLDGTFLFFGGELLDLLLGRV